MLLLDEKARSLLENSVLNEFEAQLSDYFKDVSEILREDSENIDLSGFQNRCNWIISKVVENKNVILNYSDSENFKELFKDVVIGTGDQGQITVTISNTEVTGNTRFLCVVLIIYAFVLYTNFKSLGEQFDKIGGALVQYFSEKLALELGRRCDLSSFTINGDAIRTLCGMIHSVSPVVNIYISVLGMLLIQREFTKTVQTICLLLATAAKSRANNSIGFLYSFLEKAANILHIDLEFLVKDLYYQFRVILPL